MKASAAPTHSSRRRRRASGDSRVPDLKPSRVKKALTAASTNATSMLRTGPGSASVSRRASVRSSLTASSTAMLYGACARSGPSTRYLSHGRRRSKAARSGKCTANRAMNKGHSGAISPWKPSAMKRSGADQVCWSTPPLNSMLKLSSNPSSSQARASSGRRQVTQKPSVHEKSGRTTSRTSARKSSTGPRTAGSSVGRRSRTRAASARSTSTSSTSPGRRRRSSSASTRAPTSGRSATATRRSPSRRPAARAAALGRRTTSSDRPNGASALSRRAARSATSATARAPTPTAAQPSSSQKARMRERMDVDSGTGPRAAERRRRPGRL